MSQAVQDQKEVRIGDYVITGRIGQGGIAVIFKARQESLNRDVAIKMLSSKLTNDPEIVRRFERESLVVAKLNHPNIVHIIDRGEAGDRYYFVMDYIDGSSLREVIDSAKIPLQTKLEMVVQSLKALDYAHKNGVIHRDIKPANILVDRQGNALVADFGIAQIVGTPDHEMTASDVVMGTMAYMSPEQKLSSTNVDQTTDIYAMGIIIYEILVGKKPQGHFKMPSEINSSLSKDFDKIILNALAQEPKERYQTAVELKDAILDAIDMESGAPAKDEFTISGTDSFLGKCRHLDTIKETQFSSTVLVENRDTKKLFVIKKHQRGDTGRKEAKMLTSLKHRNIINVLGCGGDRKNTAIISEYAQGGSLADRMARKYDLNRAMKIILAVASGLDFAHKNNIVHGNLRPSNVLFDNREEVRLSDFGMPAHYDAANKRNWYASPERKRSKQADIYAMGVILHQLLTGRNPAYDSGSNLQRIEATRRLPDEVFKMLSKMLGIRVARRYRSCDEFLLDWDDFEQRRKRAVSKRVVAKKPPKLSPRSTPIWQYVVFGVVVVVAVVVVLQLIGIPR